MDLCGDCWSSAFSRELGDKDHVPTHNLIQLLHPLSLSDYYDYFLNAKSVVSSSKERVSAGEELSCNVCHKVITEKTYWCCVPCISEWNIPQGLTLNL